jgi:hypothetical protein
MEFKNSLIHIKKANGLLVSIFPSEKNLEICPFVFGFVVEEFGWD